MKTVVITAIVASFASLPLYAFDNLVMPQLQSLKNTYQNAENVANSISTEQ